MKNDKIMKAYDTIQPSNEVKNRILAEVMQEKTSGQMLRTKRVFPLIAAIVVILIASATAFAAFGGIDWFIERFNPPFAEVLDSVMAYSEEQGVRMTVIGAQRFDNMAIVYLSVQDVSGENRLTENLQFPNGFLVSADETDDEYLVMFQQLHFDNSTNTAYMKLQIIADVVIADPLVINIGGVRFDRTGSTEGVEGNWQVAAYTVGGAANQVAAITNDIWIGNYLFEFITVTSIGMQTTGSFTAESNWISMTAYVETSDGLIRLHRGSGWHDYTDYSFNLNWQPDSTLDVAAVTAIIINDVRIPIPCECHEYSATL